MYSPNIQKYPVNNSNKFYFTPDQYQPLPNVASHKNSQISKQLRIATNPQSSNRLSTPKGSTSPQYSQLRSATSLNFIQNFSENKSNGINLNSRPSLQMNSFRNNNNSKSPLSPPRYVTTLEQRFFATSNILINKPNNNVYPLQLSSNQQNQNSTSMKLDLLPQENQLKIKNLQNQLKFEQKYSNDLYKENEKYKAQIVELKNKIYQLTEHEHHLQDESNRYREEINRVSKQFDKVYKANKEYQAQIAQLKKDNSQLIDKEDHFEKLNSRLIDQTNQVNKHMDELYTTHEQGRIKMKQLEEQNLKLSKLVDQFQIQKDRVLEQTNKIRQEMEVKEQKILHLDKLIDQKDIRISKIQAYSRSQNVIIADLNSKIQNFNQYYNSAIYDQRINVLNQEVTKLQKKLNQNTYENNRLAIDLRLKNEKILTMMDKQNFNDNRTKSQPKDANNEMANKMINRSFEGAIKQYQTAIDELRAFNERKIVENCKLSEEIIEYAKEIEILTEENRILSLKNRSSSLHIFGKSNAKDNSHTRAGELQDELNDLSNKLNMLEIRYMSALKEINKKDQFLKEHLLARTQEAEQKKYIESVMKKYINTFDSRFALIEQVQLLEQEIKKYEATT